MKSQEQLAEQCLGMADLAREALVWIDAPQNAETVGPAKKSLTRMLRRGARRAERLGRSARTKMSVSVFGPSQAGKSFLVSVLARPAEGRLVADFNGPGGKLDYISQINPAGDGESTGLVTRFTMSKAPTPDGFPIQLNLLSEADIARTIINSFYEDGDQSEPQPDADALQAHFQAHSPKARSAEVAGLSFEEVYEIAEYVEQGFGKVAYAAGLKGFWDEAAYLAPRMSIADRGAFLSILWGGYPELTDLYVKLATALAVIDHAEVVYAPLAALQPRETSIIDVNTLQGLYGPSGADQLTLRTAAGREARLDRAIVCALAAELVFPMESQPSDLFAETDLLDFPGARNRFELPLSKTLARPEEAVTNMLLRGKVAYLFDRYVANQEITSMLLCVPDSNMDTVSLPGLVEHWINVTHGATPRERAKSDCILFFVLTKFDKHLGESASGGSASERFERRMDASLLKGFGKLSDSWVHRWNESEPFRNCYWLRNPNYFVDGLIDYDGEQREIRIRAEKQARVAELRDGCLGTPAVRAHFGDPERAWDAALTMNDGGVGYLVGELAKVCSPDSKLRQIQVQADRIAQDILAALAPYHVSGDLEKRIEEKRAAAALVIDALERALRNHRFGAVLAALMVDQDAIHDRIARVPSSVRLSSAVSAAIATEPAAAAASGLARPGRPARPGGGAPAPAAPAEAAPAQSTIRTMTPEAFQAETAIEVWIEGLGRLRGDEAALAAYGFDAGAANDLVTELIQAVARLAIRDDIVEELRRISFGLTIDKQAQPAAIICAERINHFVATLGMEKLPPSQRPTVELPGGGTRTVFAARAAADDADTLPRVPRPVAEDLWSDWVYALDETFAGNAKGGTMSAEKIEQNLRLGRILSGLGGGMSLEIRPDPAHPFGGHALLLFEAAAVPGAEARVSVFDSYSERYLAPGGWQSAPVTFGPFPVTREGARARIAVGPEIVNRIEENAPLRIGIGEAEFEIDWPIDVHPEAAEARQADASATEPTGETGEDGASEAGMLTGTTGTTGGSATIVDPAPVVVEPSRRPMLLIGGGLALLALAAGAWFLSREEPAPTPAPVETPEETPAPPPEPAAACDAAGLGALAGQPFPDIAARLAGCGSSGDQDAALGLIEDGAAANDPAALLLFGKLYDGAVEVPGIETALALTFEDAPATAAEYYSRARAAGATEAADLLGPLCARLREATDTLSQGAVADHCDP